MQRTYISGAALTTLLFVVGVAAMLLVAVFFYCPCSRLPGGYLLGNEVAEPVKDWTFANQVPLCQLEVDAGLPHSVNLNCMASEGRLYLSCANCAGKRWSEAARRDPAARLRVDSSVYPVTLTRVEDPAELDIAWRARAVKVGTAVDAPRPEGWWSFRVESR
jgi:hypothetical protein